MEHASFRHRALVYEGAEEYLAGTLPFLKAALEADEPALVAVRPAQTEWLRRGLGEAGRRVRFLLMEEVGRNPALIIPLWRDFLDEHEGRAVRGIGEPVWGERSPAALEECQRHEVLLNLAFAEDPDFMLLCPYDAASLPSHVMERMAVSHRHLSCGGRLEESADFDTALDCFAGELPPPAVEPATFGFGLTELTEVRERVTKAARRAGMNPGEVADLVTATSELAANSVMHGGGTGTLRVWCDSGMILVEVEDRGRIEDPLVGRRRPDITQEGGRGLWLANQLCDLVQIRSGDWGTVVRLHMPVGAGVAAPGSAYGGMDPRAETSNA
ncbi:MAG: anti-sigma factor RsbA family regulatory protein [Solirubrobacterales bacterium]